MPCSCTRTSGCAFWTAATAARGASAAVSSASWSSLVSALPGTLKVTSTERPSCETVLARCCASSGLSMSVTPSILSRRWTTSFTAAVTSGSSDLIEPLPWMSTRSPISSEKFALSTMVSCCLDSPLPILDDSRFCWPTLPPITVARTTKRIHPRMAVLRCCADHLPARPARLRCIAGEAPGEGSWGQEPISHHAALRPRRSPSQSRGVTSPSAGALTVHPAVRPAPREGAAGRASRSQSRMISRMMMMMRVPMPMYMSA